MNDLKYRQALVDTFVNRIYLYDDKMTVLYNTQDSHLDVTIDDLSSSRVAFGGLEGIRTLDLSDANRTLSQLSYEPICAFCPPGGAETNSIIP